MQSALYEAEHDAFRETVRAFCAKEIVPHHDEWEEAGIVDRGALAEAGEQGLLGIDVPEEYGGGGVHDFRFNAVLAEEITRVGAQRRSASRCTTTSSRRTCSTTPPTSRRPRWLPGVRQRRADHRDRDDRARRRLRPAGHPDHGAAATATTTSSTARRRSSPTASTPTWSSSSAKTDPEAGAHGFSLLVVERGMPGFERGRNLDKIGLKAQDTAELFFDDVRVPGGNLLGEEGKGFIHLMTNLPQERLSIAVGRGRRAPARSSR